MKKLFLLLLLPVFSLAQQGIHFEHNLSWKEIQAKAKAENKFIFMDAFTTWCGPCRYMSSTIFPLENVGDFFNKNFINVKAQLDSTKNDSEEVKNWYADAHDVMKNYKVNAFPTYLFFDPNGKVIHRAVGSSEAYEFITKASDALNPEKQYYTLLDQYNAGNKSPELLKRAAIAAQDIYDKVTSSQIGNEYLATQKDLMTKENIDFIDHMTISTKGYGFAFIMNNQKKYDEVKGSGSANSKIADIIAEEEVFPVIMKKDSVTPDWTALTASINEKYPAYSKEAVLKSKAMYYMMKSDWLKFQDAVVAFMNKYGAHVAPDYLNEFAWAVFVNCKDMTCVKDALDWSKRFFKDNNNPHYIDTYANILYKLGNTNEAIKWEEKAVALSDHAKLFQDTLDKMKKGEKTWKE